MSRGPGARPGRRRRKHRIPRKELGATGGVGRAAIVGAFVLAFLYTVVHLGMFSRSSGLLAEILRALFLGH
ncbi:MAG: hypothetical protein KatS3mg076_2122 [Candidatus Binatia bacterium]|nr:MAG: hypothetical protein KatS3mg076_2122 [Candidatus Binatia bacterium]